MPEIAYSKKIADKILVRLAAGETLKKICKTPGMPYATTVRRWAIYDQHGFADRYYIARDMGNEALVDECLAIADNKGDVQRDKLRIETRKWAIDKMAPKKFHYITKGNDAEANREAKQAMKSMTDEEITEKIEEIKNRAIARMARECDESS